MRRTFSQATYYYPLYGAAFLITLALCWLMAATGYSVQPLEVRDYNMRRCELEGNAKGPVLRILDAVYADDLDMFNAWCTAPAIPRHFSALELRSVHRDHLDLRELYESRYDLMLAKPELIDSGSRGLNDGIGYHLIAQYPDYGSQLVSLGGTPELSAAWMKGKTLGLLDDPNSVSAYQVPKAALQASGLVEAPTIIYFRSYRQLYKALFAGQVDVIAAFLSDEGPTSALQLPPGLILEEAIAGPGWYIRKELLYSPAHCKLLTALEQLAQDARLDFFRDLRLVGGCDGE